jgi:Tfp pilus assembly protein PilF
MGFLDRFARGFGGAGDTKNASASEAKPTVEPYVAQGTAAGERQDWPASIESFEQALAIDPNCAKAHCGLALAYAAKLDMAKAKEHYTELARLDPDLATRLAASPGGMMVVRGGGIIGM